MSDCVDQFRQKKALAMLLVDGQPAKQPCEVEARVHR